MRKLIELVIRRVRGESDYRIDAQLTSGELLIELRGRGIALLRSLWKLAGVRGGVIRFVESRCSITHRRHLTIGRGSVLGSGTHLACLSFDGVHLGRSVSLGRGVIVKCTGVLWNKGLGLTVGDASSIGDYSFLGCAGGVCIGSNVLIGQRVSFHSQNHNFDDADRSIKEQGIRQEGIEIEDDCWVGAGVIFLDGVSVGRGSVVAAGSVVTKSFPPRSVIAGVPAALVRERAPVPAD